VIVGMGAVLQEKFLLTLRSLNWQGAGYTCGGFFHQTADTITYYPKIIDQLQLRWAYRIFKEPKLFLRYSIQYPKFIFILLFDTLSKRD
jgi:N-acetylglucosaminyldiphosphoundecaprenol N-acetyl-beta-D-mannosaminyltransferase